MFFKRSFLVLFFSIQIPSLAFCGSTLFCRGLFVRNDSGRKIILQADPKVKKNHEFFEVIDRNNDIFFFRAYLGFEGRLYISAILSYPEINLRSSMNGQDLYKQMITHFGAQNIREIVGTWVEGTNYDQYFSNLNKGLSVEDAVRRTWAGNQAERFGFSEVRFLQVLPNAMTGKTEIIVHFQRPTGSKSSF